MALDYSWYPSDTIEGGYLVDFDREKLLFYSCDLELLDSLESDINLAWRGWEVICLDSYEGEFKKYCKEVIEV